MRALYCQSGESFLGLLRPMFAHLDSLYWIVDCQGSPIGSDWIYESDENERTLFAQVQSCTPCREMVPRPANPLWEPGFV